MAYSPLKHPLQGGSILTSSCPNKVRFIVLRVGCNAPNGACVNRFSACMSQDPAHKLVFIKTHKTGSSTLTNLFHRFGYKFVVLSSPCLAACVVLAGSRLTIVVLRREWCLWPCQVRTEFRAAQGQHVLRVACQRRSQCEKPRAHWSVPGTSSKDVTAGTSWKLVLRAECAVGATMCNRSRTMCTCLHTQSIRRNSKPA